MKETRKEFRKEVREFLTEHNRENGWGTTTGDLIETLQDSMQVWRGDQQDRRWWYDETRVVQIGDKFIAYPWAVSTRDMSAEESGWVMNLNLIHFVKPVEKIVVVYEPAGDG